MNFFYEYNTLDAKLVKLLDENQLIRKVNVSGYPITLTITPNVSPEAQMAMCSMADEGVSSRDAKLTFSFPVGAIGVKVSGRLCISDSLMGKIKGLAKKMHYMYLQAEYATRNEFKRADVITPAAGDDDQEGDEGDFSEFLEDEADPEGEDE